MAFRTSRGNAIRVKVDLTHQYPMVQVVLIQSCSRKQASRESCRDNEECKTGQVQSYVTRVDVVRRRSDEPRADCGGPLMLEPLSDDPLPSARAPPS